MRDDDIFSEFGDMDLDYPYRKLISKLPPDHPRMKRLRRKPLFTRERILLLCLRVPGWVAVFAMFCFAKDLLFQTQLFVFGPSPYLGRCNVIFSTELGSYTCVNSEGVTICNIWFLLLISVTVMTASGITLWGLNRSRLSQKLPNQDKLLLAALTYSMLLFGGLGIQYLRARYWCYSFFYFAEKSRTVADYEDMFGGHFFRKTVTEKDLPYIQDLARFEKSGFAPGRELRLFRYLKPSFYLLVWSENGKIVHIDWCDYDDEDDRFIAYWADHSK